MNVPYYSPMNTVSRRDFVTGSTALGPRSPKLSGYDAAVKSYVDYLFALA